MSSLLKLSLALISTVSFLHIIAQDQEITLDKIWRSPEFSPRYVSGIRSMDDGIHYTRLEREKGNQFIVKYSYKTGEVVDTLLRTSDLKTNSGETIFFSEYEFGPDENKLLLAVGMESIYRYSSRSNYYSYDLRNQILKPITDFSKGKQELAAFSPTSNQVAFVRDNNLFISNLSEGTEIQVTTDGKKNEIINGAIDWVYEEEFGFDRGFYWSPDGKNIAYYRFNESAVPEFDMTVYSGLYPEEIRFKYPKAGEANSEVRIFIYDLEKNEKREVDINPSADQYIPRIKWTPVSGNLAIMRMNRLQNNLEFLLTKSSSSNASGKIPVEIFYTEKSETYIDINDNLIFLEENPGYFLWNSEKDGWNHIYLFNTSGDQVAQLTRGPWEVVDFYGVDEKSKRVFFSAAVESAIEQAVYSTSYKGMISQFEKSGKSILPEKDMRNGLTKLTGNRNMNNANFSNNFSYFINFESGANFPYQIALYNDKGKKVRDLETNDELKKTLDKYNLSPKEFGKFEASGGYELNYWMIKPPDFDASKEYPVMFMVYGGPGRNTVMNAWEGSSYLWHQLLAQKGIIVVSVDPRGTMRRGRDFKHSTYMDLGKLETEDMIESARYFGGLDYVDEGRIGIMGWSYGGYMSSLAITKGADQFDLAIAVAPVTNWRYYDTIYTERFMRTPQENPEGYDQNSPINFVSQLEGDYLLIHGGADDNVHLQNTMEMIEALVEADKQFELFIYPNKNHGIYGGNTRYHLFTKMTDFILENL